MQYDIGYGQPKHSGRNSRPQCSCSGPIAYAAIHLADGEVVEALAVTIWQGIRSAHDLSNLE